MSDVLNDRRVLVALSGGIACYKVASLVSRLSQRGAQVRVIMSEAATKFITPLTLQALSGSAVLTSVWEHDDRPDAQHVGLARWCELFVLAPGSADMIGKLAHGLCDDVVSLTACALPGDTRRLVAPAMNAQMWANPAVAKNVATLEKELGYTVVGPEQGWQACRTTGAGRMSEPEAIAAAVERLLG